MLSLEFARIKSDLILTFKILHNIVGISSGLFQSTNNTRAKGLCLQQPLTSTNVSASLFKFRIRHLWNNMPVNATMLSSMIAVHYHLVPHFHLRMFNLELLLPHRLHLWMTLHCMTLHCVLHSHLLARKTEWWGRFAFRQYISS